LNITTSLLDSANRNQASAAPSAPTSITPTPSETATEALAGNPIVQPAPQMQQRMQGGPGAPATANAPAVRMLRAPSISPTPLATKASPISAMK
jgi:hypothetical protein